ncbi:MAG TPA: 30S ribosomal protein S1 [Tissierellaceae bacterium]|nr:30S ribosomal protein S1 [Tissierellaceae bacterium]
MDNLNNNEMMEAIESSFTQIHKGDIIQGEVIFVTEDEVMVNIHYTSDGIITKDELYGDADVNLKDDFKEGDQIEVYVVKVDDGEGNVVLSVKKVDEMKKWELLEQKYADSEAIEVQVSRAVKGGLIAFYEGISGFIPASHVSARYVTDLEQFKDRIFKVKLLDFDKRKRRIIFSRKKVEQEELNQLKKDFWENIEINSIIKGTVQRLTNFGAFVDLGGVDGLIHISDLSWNRITHPSEIVNPGDEVEVKVLDFDKDKNRISLGLKQTTEEPWEIFKKNVEIGDIVKGTIVNLLDFGAFIRLEEGVDGLLHVSEISKDHINKPSDVLEIGEEIIVKVIDINYNEKRISLSKKEAESDEENTINAENNKKNDNEDTKE